MIRRSTSAVPAAPLRARPNARLLVAVFVEVVVVGEVKVLFVEVVLVDFHVGRECRSCTDRRRRRAWRFQPGRPPRRRASSRPGAVPPGWRHSTGIWSATNSSVGVSRTVTLRPTSWRSTPLAFSRPLAASAWTSLVTEHGVVDRGMLQIIGHPGIGNSDALKPGSLTFRPRASATTTLIRCANLAARAGSAISTPKNLDVRRRVSGLRTQRLGLLPRA